MVAARLRSEIRMQIWFEESSPSWNYAPRFRARTLPNLWYRIIYQVAHTVIRIVAIIYTSRDPRAWIDGLE